MGVVAAHPSGPNNEISCLEVNARTKRESLAGIHFIHVRWFHVMEAVKIIKFSRVPTLSSRRFVNKSKWSSSSLIIEKKSLNVSGKVAGNCPCRESNFVSILQKRGKHYFIFALGRLFAPFKIPNFNFKWMLGKHGIARLGQFSPIFKNVALRSIPKIQIIIFLLMYGYLSCWI